MVLTYVDSSTGYKLRQQISKALQRRSEAIRKAIARYNDQAARLTPPRPPISWKDITKYTFIGEFDLLRHTRDDVRERIWARPAVREATSKFFKLCRAKEEITRLNVEIRRLRTAIHDEEKEVAETAANLRESEPLLAHELVRLHQSRAAVNAVHIHRLSLLRERFGLVEQTKIGTRMKAPHSTDEMIPDGVDQDINVPGDFQEDDEPAPRRSLFLIFVNPFLISLSTTSVFR